MKIRFYTMLALIVAMFIGGISTAHAQDDYPSTGPKPVLCIGSEQHEVFAGSDDTEIVGGNTVYSCVKNNQNVIGTCDLEQDSLSHCLSNHADQLVKHGQPRAWNVFRLYVNVNGKQTHVDILTPKSGAIAGSFNGVAFNLQTIAKADGTTQVNYIVNGAMGGYNFAQYDWVQTDSKSFLQRL